MMKVRMLLLLTCFLPLAGCNKSDDLLLGFSGEGNRPDFLFNEHKKLTVFEVYERKDQGDGGVCYCLVWGVEAEDRISEGGGPRTIRFGVVPAGYAQYFPRNGDAAPPLKEGTVYEYKVISSGAPEDRDQFHIQNGRPSFVLMD